MKDHSVRAIGVQPSLSEPREGHIARLWNVLACVLIRLTNIEQHRSGLNQLTRLVRTNLGY
jgi:hypothetical protein